MTNIDPPAGWPDVPQLEVTQRVLAGPSGPMNSQANSLVARTKQLRDDVAQATAASEQNAADLALLTSELGSAAFTSADAYATAAQGAAADSASANLAALTGTVENLQAAQQTSAIYKATLADLQAVTGSYVGQGGFVTGGTGAGTYGWDGSAWVFLAADMLASKADKAATAFGLASLGRSTTDALTQVTVAETAVVQVAHNATIAAVSNRAVYSAAEAAAGQPVNAFRFWMQNVPTLGPVTLAVYSRVQAGSTSAYPPTANDTLLTTVTVEGEKLAASNDWQFVEFRLPQEVTTLGTDLLVWKLSAAGGLSIGIRNDATGVTQFRRGWFGNTGGGSQLIGAPNRLAYEAYLREVESVLDPQLAALESQAQIAERSFVKDFSPTAAHSPNGAVYPQTDGHYAFTFGAQTGPSEDVPAGQVIDTLALSVQLASSIATLRLRVWSRPTNPATASTYPTADATATLLSTQLLTPAELGLDPASNAWQALRYAFPAISTSAGTTYLFEIWAFTAANANVGIGITRAADVGYNPQQRGWYRGGSTIPTGSALAWQLGGLAYTQLIGVADAKPSALADAYDVTLVTDGLQLAVSGTGYCDGLKVTVNGAVSVSAAAQGTETTNNYDLIYSTATVFTSIPGAWIGRRNLSDVTAVRSTDGAALTLGVDFAYHVNGKLRGLVDTAPFAVNATYNYKRERYDVVQLDPQTQAVSLKEGVERDFDAIEYLPEPDPGFLPVGYLHVIGGSVTPINACEFLGSVTRFDSTSDWQQLLLRNRQALPKLHGRIARGEPVTVAAYGDSIVAIQTGNVDYTANGVNRDRPETYLTYVPADTVAALPKYDFGDGAGPVHIKISAPWSLVAAIGKRSSAAVDYLNFGIGGTNSADTVNNGLYPARLAPMIASGAHLLLIHFGMNELGQTATLSRVANIAQQAMAAGMEVVIMGVPRRNSVDGATMSGWYYTNRALYLAAKSVGCAFAPQHWIGRPDQLGGIRASAESLAMANLINHPGPSEFRRYGDLLVQSVLP